MPKVSGLELTAELRAFDPRTPILFFSGVVRENEIRTAYEAGAQGYLIKPASPEKIVAEVKRLLAAAETPAYRHY